MNTLRSKDGTSIAFDQSGHGPALILVGGALSRRGDAASAAAKLAPAFTVFAYDRRGRGDSGDAAQPRERGYSPDREVEDLDALIGAAGGRAFLYGHSSGAVLALEAARRLPGRVVKLALYEPPFIIDDSRPPVPQDYVARLTELIAAGRPGPAVEYFMTNAVGVPADVVASMRNTPMWAGLEESAQTLPYDGVVMGDTMRGDPAPLRRWASVSIPTLVMDGGESPGFMHHSAEEIARILPHAQHRRFPGQGHGAADEVLVPALVEFFGS